MIPNPGSDDAIAYGCTCDPVENRGGEGISAPERPGREWVGPTVFVYDRNCPLHGDGDWHDMNEQVAREFG